MPQAKAGSCRPYNLLQAGAIQIRSHELRQQEWTRIAFAVFPPISLTADITLATTTISSLSYGFVLLNCCIS